MNDKTEDFTVKAQRLRDAREKIIELIKGSPDQVDIAVRQFDQHRAMMYGLRPEYPLLVDKALKRIRCESPNFTEGELQERRRLIENLVAAVIAPAIKRRANKQKGQREQDADIESIQRDCHDYLNTGLYLLARCGDESAYLELAERDITFWSNYFFHVSYLEWKLMAYHGDKKQVESRLRKLATIFQKPCEPPTKTRQDKKDHFILGQFQEYKERFPKLSRNKIYEKIAKDWKVEYGEQVTPDAVRKRLERFHKCAWPFKYFEREYREEI